MALPAVIKFDCPGCRQRIRLPGEAAGRRARCGSCKEVVRVPALQAPKPEPKPARAVNVDEELGDFLSDMLSEDREFGTHDAFAPPKKFDRAARQAARARETDELSEEDEDALDALRERAPEPEPAARAKPAAGAPRPPAAPAPASQAATPAPRVAAAATAAAAPPAGYPVDANPGPFLMVRSISAVGIRLCFPMEQLRDPRFRASVPGICVFSGKPLGGNAYARPMVFNNQHEDGDELVRMVELRNEKAIRGKYSAAAFVEETGLLEELPPPLNLAMPYAVSAGHHESSLACEAHISNTAAHAGYCEVVIPSPEAALAWVAAVNGICHESFALLQQKGSRVSSEAWTRLPQSTRDRIGMWCTFRKGEHFRAYARDSHSSEKDAGLGGILVTDQRLVFHLYRTTWSLPLSEPLTLFVRARNATFGLAALPAGGEMRPMCNVLRGDAALLFDALEAVAENLKVETEDEGLAEAA
ncbi:hypothetical protein [Phycisphaera mikurensis]|uniref:Uncharacterized protein n=1 Tax=Phycisphaera mikurensis (strain NBRC 102666 / KCTC 22515 / FYK2301M01) TaxID=1142394 RepID=I0IDJ1_PHYMF|nr:hypothetical protein [Phycisphaera mikurensis]MBB6441149.1 hypothetical protein [Phycisphaera mikurensis]BAM03329.1 hypothetical protein PSMK_11700 [Phycisphaera mikurensis NBRC 102666]